MIFVIVRLQKVIGTIGFALSVENKYATGQSRFVFSC